jgi:hypothetical protein
MLEISSTLTLRSVILLFVFNSTSGRGQVMLKNHRNSDSCKYKKQRNRVNDLKKIAKGNFEINLDNIILENASNNKKSFLVFQHFFVYQLDHIARLPV